MSTAVAPPAHGLGSPTEVPPPPRRPHGHARLMERRLQVPGISTDMVPGTDELISRVRVLCAGDSDASVEKATVLRLQDATQAAMSRTLGAKVTSRLLQVCFRCDPGDFAGGDRRPQKFNSGESSANS
eukprot:scaffold1436_cov250-Pinguiococcus_pyrenoidosus.AAC.10